MDFYGYFRSSSSYRCRIAFNLKGVEPRFEPVHLKNGAQHSAAFKALNPQGLLPALVTDEGDVLIQSLAIIEWLNETIPTPPLLSQNATTRARERGFAQVIACETHPLQNLRVLKYLSGDLGLDEAAKDAWLTRWLRDGLEACEALLAQRSAHSRFCYGDTPGLADICLVPQVFSAERFGIAYKDLPHVCAVYTACQALSAFDKAAPKNQPDFEA
ncbi:maleylacetoacetate isomerase [uncultured Lentibacter sp.]|uniref:maleylacetoacetate isomerase n=1 Tax=uncultured Lentibacter sp. TaxID=1659309 RepID=UPI002607958D|nr:maleylacetoacetate isomerase [uncultured Lentibacter sp.]MCW1955284.1 maleylacetoacetate isomerase [Roseobacter sp.]